MLGPVLFQTGPTHQFVHGKLYDLLRGIATDITQFLQRIGAEGVRKLVDLDIFLILCNFPVYVYFVPGQARSQPDIDTTPSDRLADLFGLYHYLCTRRIQLLVDCYANRVCRRKRPLNQAIGIAGVFQHIYIFVTQFTNDRVNTNPLHAYTGPHRIDSLIVAQHSHLGPLARLTNDAFDFHDTLVYLGHLQLEQPLHKNGIGPANDNLRIVAKVSFHLLYNRPEHVSLTITILEYLLRTRKHQFHLVVNHKHLAPPRLVDLAHHYFADQVGVILVYFFFFDIPDALTESLTGRHYCATTKPRDIDLTGYFLPDLEILIHLSRVIQFDFRDRILQVPVFHNILDVDDLDIPVIRIENDVEVVVCTVPLANHGSKNILDDQREGVTIDILFARNLCKRRYKCRALHVQVSLAGWFSSISAEACRSVLPWKPYMGPYHVIQADAAYIRA